MLETANHVGAPTCMYRYARAARSRKLAAWCTGPHAGGGTADHGRTREARRGSTARAAEQGQAQGHEDERREPRGGPRAPVHAKTCYCHTEVLYYEPVVRGACAPAPRAR